MAATIADKSTRHDTRGRKYLGCKRYRFNFGTDAIDSGDTWTSNIPNIFAVAWDGALSSTVATAATVTNRATGEITFTGADNIEGDLIVWTRS